MLANDELPPRSRGIDEPEAVPQGGNQRTNRAFNPACCARVVGLDLDRGASRFVPRPILCINTLLWGQREVAKRPSLFSPSHPNGKPRRPPVQELSASLSEAKISYSGALDRVRDGVREG